MTAVKAHGDFFRLIFVCIHSKFSYNNSFRSLRSLERLAGIVFLAISKFQQPRGTSLCCLRHGSNISVPRSTGTTLHY